MEEIYKIEVYGFYYYDDVTNITADNRYEKVGFQYLINEMYTDVTKAMINSFILPELMKGDNMDTPHHAVVTKIPFKKPFEPDTFLSQYVYMSNDIYVERNYNSEVFNGRDETTNKFKVGDKVEFVMGEHLYYGVVCGLPIGLDNNFDLDYMDDAYTVLVGYDSVPENITDEEYMQFHEHISVTKVFPRHK